MSKNRVKIGDFRIKTFYFKSFTLAIAILRKLREGRYPVQIAKEVGISKQRVNYYIRIFQDKNLIKQLFKSSCTCFTLTKTGEAFLSELQKKQVRSKKSSLGVRNLLLLPKKTRLHALTIKFPIVKNSGEEWGRKIQINNWAKQYEVLPIGITLEKTTKSIIAHFHSIEAETPLFLSEFQNSVLKGVFYVSNYLQHRGITIDFLAGQVISQHIANESPEFDKATDTKLTYSLALGRTATSIFPTTLSAKAWIDRSQGELEIETNDSLYEEKLIKMPETIAEIVPIMSEFSRQIALHLAVQRETLKTLKAIRKEL